MAVTVQCMKVSNKRADNYEKQTEDTVNLSAKNDLSIFNNCLWVGRMGYLNWLSVTSERNGIMVPSNDLTYIVRRIPGNQTGPDDDVLIDNHGGAWKKTPEHEVNSTCFGTRRTLTPDGQLI